MSGPTLVPPSTPAPDYLAEAGEILKNPDAPFILRIEHLQALQEAFASAAQVSALTNRALVGFMLDQRCAQICIPAGLIANIEAKRLDLTLEYQRGAIVATLIYPHVGPTN